MMRRTVAATAALALCVGLAGCNKGPEQAVSSKGAASAAAKPAAQPAAKAVGVPRGHILRMFHELLYYSGVSEEMEWMGVRTLQNPADMWAIQEIIFEVKPDFIIETGTFHGGSSLFFAMILDAMGSDAKILSADIEPKIGFAKTYHVFQQHVEVFTGSSTDPEYVKKVGERVRGKKVIVLLDSDHRAPHVSAELEAYAPMVSVGSYMVVQDTNLNGHPVVPDYGPGPWEAGEAFLKKHPEFEVDKSREKFLVSFHPNGYLRRTK
jgi:cephalosporin hydroxylase